MLIKYNANQVEESQTGVPDAYAYKGLQILHFYMNEYFGKGEFALCLFFVAGTTFGLFALILSPFTWSTKNHFGNY